MNLTEKPLKIMTADGLLNDGNYDRNAEFINSINSLIPSPAVARHILHMYDNFKYYYTVGESATEGFYNAFMECVRERTMNTMQMFRALYAEYNPTENYDLTTESYSGGQSENVQTRQVAQGTVTVEEATYDGSTKQTSKTSTSAPTIQSGYTGTLDKPVKFQGKDVTDAFNTITKSEERRHGNIGVTSVPDQIKKEMDIRFTNIYHAVIESICNELLAYFNTGDE